MPQFNVLTPLHHNGEIYSPGAVVEMTQQQAAALLRAAAINEKSVSQKDAKLVSNNPKAKVETEFESNLGKTIRELDLTDPSLWMKDGRPRTQVLSSIFGRHVSAKERDQIWQKRIEENRP
jgi:hypothetical protein